MRPGRRPGDRGTACLPGAPAAHGRGLIAGIVLAMLLIAAALAGLLYAVGAFREDASAPFGTAGPGSHGPVSGAPEAPA